MATVAANIKRMPANNVEVIVHINEMLEEGGRNELVNALVKAEGISSAEFCPLRYHLLLVRYSRDLMSSQDVLGEVNSQHVHAKLIGPV